MALFENFENALAHWRAYGGAMNYVYAMPHEEHDSWEIVDADDLAESIDCTPKEATIQALQMGGMDADEIVEEMRYWQD